MDLSDTKGRILKSAVELFAKFGFRSISMDDISRDLGMSKKTLYQCFSDKDEIVTLVIKARLSKEKQYLRAIQREAKDAVDFLVKVNTFLMRNIRETSSATIYDLKKYHSNGWGAVEEFRNEFLFKAVRDNLIAGMREGHFRPDINVEVLSTLRLEEISMLLNEDLFPKSSFNLPDVAYTILDHYVAGIATDHGKTLYKQYKQQEKSLTTIL
jgi:TetR/AcrR family transcriptional regulator, cholesterol catabolism regulator